MGIIKFFLSIVLLPVVVGVTKAFFGELISSEELYKLFTWGIVTYVVTHLFVVNFQGIYQGGQKVLSDGLKFSPFLSSFVPLVLPLFPLILLLAFYICSKFFPMREWVPYFIFFSGLTFAMHLILTAQILRGEDSGIFKAHYFFVMSLGYILNILLIAALLDLNFSSFSFTAFFEKAFKNVQDIYWFIYSRLMKT
jgi:hypothetical protein